MRLSVAAVAAAATPAAAFRSPRALPLAFGVARSHSACCLPHPQASLASGRLGNDGGRRSLAVAAAPTPEEMNPGSPEMLARAARAKVTLADRVLDPLAASSFVLENDDVTIVDVRTREQAERHEINGTAGLTVRGAIRRSLDDMVVGMVPLPRGKILLCCSKGPKSLVALDYMVNSLPSAENDLRVIEGGIAAWDALSLPTKDLE